eukprot:jgi/Mesvir1/12217/Mv00445-RA.1
MTLRSGKRRSGENQPAKLATPAKQDKEEKKEEEVPGRASSDDEDSEDVGLEVSSEDDDGGNDGDSEDSDGEVEGDEDGAAKEVNDAVLDYYRVAANRAGSDDEDENDEEEEEEEEDAEEKDATGEMAKNEAAVAKGPGRKFTPSSDPDDTDSSEDERPSRNTIGNVPLSWYKDEKHIGYDIDGKKILKKERKDQIDAFLARADDPKAWRTIYDAYNDEEIVLTREEVETIQRIREGKIPHAEVNPYEPYVDWFDYEDGIHPLSSAPEPKRRFVPSKWEAKLVVKLVRAMRKGWIKPRDESAPPEKPRVYLMWDDDLHTSDKTGAGLAKIPAPKPQLPGHEESYNPPDEYVPTDEERAAMELMHPDDRPSVIPRKYTSMRAIPAYADFIKERFERCLDLYLCPRTRKKKINIDPESLVPKLPRPQDLRPFPSFEGLIYRGHTSRVRSVAVDASGQWLASGSDDKSVRLWEVSSGRCFKRIELPGPVKQVVWNPNPKLQSLLCVAVENSVLLLDAGTGNEEVAQTVQQMLVVNEDAAAKAEAGGKKLQVTWEKAALPDGGLALVVSKPVHRVSWHHKGDYFATVAPQDILLNPFGDDAMWQRTSLSLLPPSGWFPHPLGPSPPPGLGRGKPFPFFFSFLSCPPLSLPCSFVPLPLFPPAPNTQAVMVHQLSRQQSQNPFKKNHGRVSSVLFHPSKPFFFVATASHVRVYNLVKQQLAKKLAPAMNEISCMAVHPGGDNLLVGSVDNKIAWFDLDLSTKPYKSLRNHEIGRGVVAVAYHRSFPLFASCSDDGTAHVFHGMVYADLLQNALMVPLKILRGHAVVSHEGVMDCVFHPNQPWLFTAGADQTVRLWCN